MKSSCLIVLTVLLSFGKVWAMGPNDTTASAINPSLEVAYLGIEGDYLLFTVKAAHVTGKTIFAIRNEAGDDIYRTWQSEASSLRRIRILRNTARTLHFVLGNRKQQCTKTFTINTSVVETIQVKEAGQ